MSVFKKDAVVVPAFVADAGVYEFKFLLLEDVPGRSDKIKVASHKVRDQNTKHLRHSSDNVVEYGGTVQLIRIDNEGVMLLDKSASNGVIMKNVDAILNNKDFLCSDGSCYTAEPLVQKYIMFKFNCDMHTNALKSIYKTDVELGKGGMIIKVYNNIIMDIVRTESYDMSPNFQKYLNGEVVTRADVEVSNDTSNSDDIWKEYCDAYRILPERMGVEWFRLRNMYGTVDFYESLKKDLLS